MSSIQHIAELFIYDERDFITAAYRTLLGREPDPVGMNYYLGRIRMGYGKAAIIVQLATSAEAFPQNKINGLSNLIKDERRANHWFWGIFSRPERHERILQQQITELKRLRHQMEHPAYITKTEQLIQNNIDALKHLTHIIATSAAPHSGNDMTASSDINPETATKAEPEEFNRLSARARGIYLQLKQAAALQAGGAA